MRSAIPVSKVACPVTFPVIAEDLTVDTCIIDDSGPKAGFMKVPDDEVSPVRRSGRNSGAPESIVVADVVVGSRDQLVTARLLGRLVVVEGIDQAARREDPPTSTGSPPPSGAYAVPAPRVGVGVEREQGVAAVTVSWNLLAKA